MSRIFIGIILAICVAPFSAAAQGQPAGVLTDVVTEKQANETIVIFGELVAERQSRVAARISGVADNVPVEVGDSVSAGDVLAEIDGDLLGIELARAEADLAVAEAAVSTAKLEVATARTAYNRAASLREKSIIADATYEERLNILSVAEGRRAEAEARVNVMQIALRRAKYDLDNAIVRAPFGGVVIAVGTEVGQFVDLGAEVVRLIDASDIRVEASIPARYIQALEPGQTIYGKTDSGGMVVLELRAVLPTEFSSTRTRPVIFEVISKEGIPAAGQSVTLNVPVSAPRTVPAVPKDALVQGRGGWQVFIAADGVAQPRRVEIGIALGDSYEVISGLAAGDVVVVRGNERLRPGQQISPTPVGARQGGADGPEQSGGEAGSKRQQAAVRPKQ